MYRLNWHRSLDVCKLLDTRWRASTRSVWMLTIFNISLIWRVEARRRTLTHSVWTGLNCTTRHIIYMSLLLTRNNVLVARVWMCKWSFLSTLQRVAGLNCPSTACSLYVKLDDRASLPWDFDEWVAGVNEFFSYLLCVCVFVVVLQ